MSDTGVVTFNYDAWVAIYSEFLTVPALAAQNYFNMATLYCDNTAGSRVPDAAPGGKRETILYMLTAHVTALVATVAGKAPPSTVGRISSATQGSVSVTSELPVSPGAAWFSQTRYGLMAWQAMAPYRTAMYTPPPFTQFIGGRGWPLRA